MQVNGIELNVEAAGAGPAVLLLHGFTGNIETWTPFLDAWKGFRTVRLDIIGHGESEAPADPERYSMTNAVADLLALLDQLGIEQTAVVGYSMGGRLAIHLAVAAPQRLWGLVLEGASPGIENEDERAARVVSDRELADEIGRHGIEAFVNRWQAMPIFATQSRLPKDVFERQRRQRLASNPEGIANSLRGMGAGTQAFLLPELQSLPVPTLLLAGANDKTYSAIARALEYEMPDAVCEIIPDAGHAAHLENPERFGKETLDFLKRCAARKKPQEIRP